MPSSICSPMGDTTVKKAHDITDMIKPICSMPMTICTT